MAEVIRTTARLTRGDLNPGVREHADMLYVQLKAVFVKEGIENSAQFNQAVLKNKIDLSTLGRIKAIVGRLDSVLTTGKLPEITMEYAKDLFGGDFFGPDQVGSALDIAIPRDEIPDIPFSQDELEQAKKLGCFLILRVDKTPDGTPLTMQNLEKMLGGKILHEYGHNILDHSSNFDRDFLDGLYNHTFNEDVPRAGWALISKQAMPSSIGKNYLNQTSQLGMYLTEFYKGKPMPAQYGEAIAEFNKQYNELTLRSLLDYYYNRTTLTLQLIGLQLNQLLRETFVETLYGTAVHFLTTKEIVLRQLWTCSSGEPNRIIKVRSFAKDLVTGRELSPREPDNNVGVYPSLFR